MTDDVKDLLVKRIQELEAEIQPQRDAIAAAEEEIRRSRAALDALEGNLPSSGIRTAPRATARAASTSPTTRGAKPDADVIVRWMTQNADDSDEGYFKSTEVGAGIEWNGSKNALTDTLKEMVSENKLTTNGKQRAALKYGLKS